MKSKTWSESEAHHFKRAPKDVVFLVSEWQFHQLLRLFFQAETKSILGTTRFLNAHSVVTPLQDIFPTRLHSFVTFVNKDDTYLLLVNNTRLPTSFQQVSQSRVEFYSTNKLLTTIYYF